MRKRVTSVVAMAVLVAALAPGIASAADVSIDDGASAGYHLQSGSWSTDSICTTGVSSQGEHRVALEFPLTSLPAGARVQGATLALRSVRPENAGQTAITGYAGDGSITPADMAVTGPTVLHTPTTATRESIDVSDLVTPAVVASGWAGFGLRQDPLGGTFAWWDCFENTAYPILTIEYTFEPATKNDCKDGGWQTLARADGSAFKNQGSCVAYVVAG